MNRHLRHMIYISIWTFFVVLGWVVFLILVKRSSPIVTDETLNLAKELNPKLDQSAFEKLRDRKEIPIDLSGGVIFSSTPEGTESAEGLSR